MRFITLITKFFTYSCAIALVLAYLSPYVPSDVFWPILFFGMAFPWLFVLNVFLLMAWSVFRNKMAIVPLVVVIFGLNYVSLFYGFNFKKSERQENFRMATYNINSFYGVRLKSHHWLKEKNPVMELIKEEKVDFTCFQELFGSQAVSKYMKEYGLYEYEERPINFFYEGSKSEFLDRGFIAKDGLNGVSWFEIEKYRKRIRIYNVHLKSNQISVDTENFPFKEDLFTRGTLSLIKKVVKKLIYFSKIRVKQAEELASHIEKCPYPVIVCGDFNELPLSYPYRIISKGLKDVFVEKGSGWGFTYCGKIPGLRLDYVLVSPEIEVIDFKIRKEKLSDHYPLIAYLKI